MRTRATSTLRLRSSHRRTLPLRISHSSPAHAWQPPVKDGDDDDLHGVHRPDAGHGKGQKRKRGG